MLIGRIEHTDTGLRLYDVDGSYEDIIAEDAFAISRWIRQHEHYQLLFDAMRRAERKERSRKDHVS